MPVDRNTNIVHEQINLPAVQFYLGLCGKTGTLTEGLASSISMPAAVANPVTLDVG